MAMVDVDASCQFSADSQPKSIGLISGLVATRRSVYIHQVNRVNSRNYFGHDDSTMKHCRGYYYYYYYYCCNPISVHTVTVGSSKLSTITSHNPRKTAVEVALLDPANAEVRKFLFPTELNSVRFYVPLDTK